MKKLTIEEFKIKLKDKHGDTITIDEITYLDTKTKAKFIDKDYGDWWAQPKSILKGRGHKQRGLKKSSIKRTISAEEIQQRIIEKHGDIIILDKTTYSNILTKARFTDKEYGDWWAAPNHVVHGHGHPARGPEKRKQTNLRLFGVENTFQSKEKQEKIKQTNLKNYGVEYPLQNPKISLKAAKTCNNSIVLHHWATGEEIVCKASYELAFVDGYLNTQHIFYLWQPETFETPFLTKTGCKSTYRPDACLFDSITGLWTWIEIKGYMRESARKKWVWFHTAHPNSVLWDRKKLKEIGLNIK